MDAELSLLNGSVLLLQPASSGHMRNHSQRLQLCQVSSDEITNKLKDVRSVIRFFFLILTVLTWTVQHHLLKSDDCLCAQLKASLLHVWAVYAPQVFDNEEIWKPMPSEEIPLCWGWFHQVLPPNLSFYNPYVMSVPAMNEAHQWECFLEAGT